MPWANCGCWLPSSMFLPLHDRRLNPGMSIVAKPRPLWPSPFSISTLYMHKSKAYGCRACTLLHALVPLVSWTLPRTSLLQLKSMVASCLLAAVAMWMLLHAIVSDISAFAEFLASKLQQLTAVPSSGASGSLPSFCSSRLHPCCSFCP